MTSFKKLNPRIYAKSGPVLTPDNEYWKKLSVPILVKEFGPIDYIHFSPVEPYYFAVTCSDKLHIASFSDDKSVRVWDIATEACVHSYTDHTDYIRAGALCPVQPDIVVSGGYDNTVRIYDTRTNATVMVVDHGSPIESLLFLPSGGMFMSAGGTDIKVWDTFAGGKLLANFSSHHKTITCMHLASNNKRLMSGSLDRHVKIYDIATFKVVHTLDFPNAVLSLAASKNDDTIVAGMVDGLVSIQRRELEMKPTKNERKMVSYKYISHTMPTVNEVIPDKVRETQAKYDTCFRKFQFTKALDTVMIPYTINKNPTVVRNDYVRNRN
ncbi:uncharacterized protein CBL_12598 [Carabus blaptoides fortunei]